MFVGGLLKKTTDETLAEYFSHYGEVASAEVKLDLETGNSRGFGFVVFAEPASVELAVNEAAGHTIEDKPVQVKKFTREHDCEKLFVGGLKLTTTSDKLSEYFSLFGTILEAEVKMDSKTGASRGFGVLQFTDQRGAQLVLDEPCHVIDGKGVDVKLFDKAQKSRRNQDEGDALTKIFLGGLSPESTPESVSTYFTHYGDIIKVDVRKGRGWGVVQFLEPESAELAVAEEEEHIVDGKHVDVKGYEARAKRHRPVTAAYEDEAEVVVEEDQVAPVDDEDWA